MNDLCITFVMMMVIGVGAGVITSGVVKRRNMPPLVEILMDILVVLVALGLFKYFYL